MIFIEAKGQNSLNQLLTQREYGTFFLLLIVDIFLSVNYICRCTNVGSKVKEHAIWDYYL